MLQKSVCTDDRKFRELEARFSCKGARASSTAKFASDFGNATEVRRFGGCFVFSRKICSPATFDFCNTIPPLTDEVGLAKQVGYGPTSEIECDLIERGLSSQSLDLRPPLIGSLG